MTHPLLSEGNHEANQPRWYPAAKGDMKSLVDDRYHFIKNGDGREELYDWEHDPWETQDLAGTEGGRPLLEQFRKSLLKQSSRTLDYRSER
jgi:hypothetical protein